MSKRKLTYQGLFFPAVCALLATVVLGLAIGYAWAWQGERAIAMLALHSLRHIIEIMAIIYGVVFTVAAVRYIWLRRQDVLTSAVDENRRERVAVIYLCCGDVELNALKTLGRLSYKGTLLHIVHDDSIDPLDQREVDRCVARAAELTGVEWRVLRRSEKRGGKSGATNFVLERTSGEHDLFLLCDNDSFAPDRSLLPRAVPLFEDETVGVVQFRNMSEPREGEGEFERLLGGAVDMFDAFMTGMYRGLWQPFVGHNALLRTDDVVAAGGFTPGLFADDIDLTVRLNSLGKRVVYRRDLQMTEHHPPNYRSFCTRSQKWATGCAQVVRAHAWQVLRDHQLGWRHKIGFLLFCGFYTVQAAMLAYVAIILLVLPLLVASVWEATGLALIVGTLFPLAIFFPVVAYLLTEGRRLPFWRTLGVCAATYGSTDWWTLRGLRAGLSSRERPWMPTNTVPHSRRWATDWAHFGFGSSCLAVPWIYQPELLFFPVTWLFAAKFLVVPAVAEWYRPRTIAPHRSSRLVSPMNALSSLAIVAGIAAILLAAGRASGQEIAVHAFPPSAPDRVDVVGGRLVIDGDARVIKGLHYSPWRTGTGPGKDFDYPSDELLAADMDLIDALGPDTLLAYDMPERAVKLVHRRGYDLIYTFHVDWWRVFDGQVSEAAAEIAARVVPLRDEPAIILYMIGNEIPGMIIDSVGEDGIAEALAQIREAILDVDPTRPVTHGNWTLNRGYSIDRAMDVVAYNIYPFYPPEVAAKGYGDFIEDEIMPRANGRPVIITEFGANTIEVSPQTQGDVLQMCWKGLLEAGCQGGMVFAFADEAWKNYNNPIAPPDWWRRDPAPDDHLTVDQDPEEYYGLVTPEREPKPAFDAVRAMFDATDSHELAPVAMEEGHSSTDTVRLVATGIILLLIGGALALRARAGSTG